MLTHILLLVSPTPTFSVDWSVNLTDLSLPCAITRTAARFASSGAEHCIEQRADGVYADPEVLGTTLLAAVDAILRSKRYFVGLDYAVLTKALYGHGPDLPRDGDGRVMVRLADAIGTFPEARRALYRSVKIADGQAEYYFEPVFETDPAGGERPARLDADEFVADMWTKGIRFGADMDAIRDGILAGAAGRMVVARRLAPRSGEDARVEEVTGDLHRSDAPRQLANGKLDLMSFQNRFPQVAKGKRLLRKVPATSGAPGFDLSGIPIAPEPPKDLELDHYAADGTAVDATPEGEFLVARQDGFLNVDPKSSRISISDKIVSRDGVSAKTTGNLQLSGDYEEFGEVQEQRVIEGDSITVHADVFGHLVSRGGVIRLDRNLVGGSARNADGAVRVRGVASSATIQSANGEVMVRRAENCVISGARVKVEEAINCEIMADEVEVAYAEGGAIAGRRVAIGRAAPRRQGEMLVVVLRPDCGRIDEAMAQVRARIDQFGELAARLRAAMDEASAEPELRKYMLLATRVRKGELVLTPAQQPQFKRLAESVAPRLKELGRLSQQAKEAEGEQQAGQALLARLASQRAERSATASVTLGAMEGEVQVRAMACEPDAGSAYDLPPREIRLRLRDGAGTELLHAGASGAWSWNSAS